MKRFLLVAMLAMACGGTDLEQGSAAAGAVQTCRIALGWPEGCLPLAGSCTCSIAGADAVISFPAAVTSSSVAWDRDPGNEESIITATAAVQSGAVHLSFSVAGGPMPGGAYPGMSGWWFDITAQ